MPWGSFGWSRWHRRFRPGWKGRSIVCFPVSWRGVQKKGSHTWRVGVTKFGELSDLDTSHPVPKRALTLAFTGSEWVAFADPVQLTGWLIDIKINYTHVATGKRHRARKWIVAPGCALISPRQKNIIIEEAQDKCSYMLKTSNSTQGILKMVSEFSPVVWDYQHQQFSSRYFSIGPDDFVDVLPGFKLKWPQTHANKELGFIY